MDAVSAIRSAGSATPSSARTGDAGGTRALASFRRTIRRCRHLLDVHRGAYGAKGVSVVALRDLPIDAVVLAVSAYRTYVADVLAEIVIARCEAAFLDGDDAEVLRPVLAEPGLAAELAVSGMRSRDEVRRVIREHFRATVSSDGSRAIRAAIRRVGVRGQEELDRPSAPRATGSSDDLDRWIAGCARVLEEPDPVSIRRDDAEDCLSSIQAAVEGVDAAAERLIREAQGASDGATA